MTLIRAGIAHRMSSSAWSSVLRELHVREHDLQELNYLHALSVAKKRERSFGVEGLHAYEPFSDFHDKNGYAGFYPSRWYINTVYMDYMEHIRPFLDQCVSALTGHVIKWDHSFKLPKYLMKLCGEVTFASLFTLLNEFEQIRFQAFVPTKSLSHVRGALEEMVKSLDKHGLTQPILGFTDNVASDAATFTQCIPALAKNVHVVQLDEFSDLPRAVLPEHVSVQICSNVGEIQTACNSILALLNTLALEAHLLLGYDQEWEFQVNKTSGGPQKTVLVSLALPNIVYLLRVHNLQKLPASLEVILNSSRILKIGRNVGGDFAKLARDFTIAVPQKRNNSREGVVELGAMAKSRNVVSSGNASLAAITAVTLNKNLSKDPRISEWSAPELSDEQKDYAALDAWIVLSIYDYLQKGPASGLPLKSAACVNQAVSLFWKKQEVAKGVIIEQPRDFIVERTSPVNMSVKINVTPTRAVIRVDEVLAPDFVLSFHKRTLEDMQTNGSSFQALVSLSTLKTRVDKVAPPEESDIDPPEMDEVIIVQPSLSGSEEIRSDDGLNSESDHVDDANILSHDFQEYSQSAFSDSNVLPSRILADVFHEIDKVCRTISKKHTHHNAFATAFSNTMLVTDKCDRLRVEAYLSEKKLPTFEKLRLEKPKWCWKRVRRYIPKKEFLYRLLNELFQCWGPIKCTVTGQALFSEETWKKVKGVLHDVRKGWISDPIGIPLYSIRFHDKHGLPVYHCIRGTNSVEGAVHNPIRRNFASLNASVELADCLIADFRHRHNIDVGTVHKNGSRHLGHYDQWLEHEIVTHRADINWITKPTTTSMTQQDIDPLAFPPTDEQFGITCIPGVDHLNCDFGGPVMMLSENSINMAQIYPTQLHLSKLKGKRNDVYSYLATAQHTKFAVTPLHTKEEFALYNSTVSRGGEEWCREAGKPIFHKMATWWSSKADGKTIFYKLPEHLTVYHKKSVDQRNRSQSMVASEQQRQAHTSRVRSDHHSAQVLDPSPYNQPGVMASTSQHISSTITIDLESIQMILFLHSHLLKMIGQK